MKKIISIALIVALAATSVFAASISGEARLGLAYDLDSKEFGFDNIGTMNSITLNFASELFNEEKEVKGEGSIYAGIKASMNVSFSIDNKTPIFTNDSDILDDTEITNKEEWETVSSGGFFSDDEFTITITKTTNTFDFVAAIEEAYITNDVWKLNILGSKAASDYAISAIDSYEDKEDDDEVKYVSAVAPSAKVNPGFIFTVDGYTVSLGLKGTGSDVDFNAFAESKKFNINGIEAQGAVVAGKDGDKVAFGASITGGYEGDNVTVTAAADVAVEKVGDADATVNADFAAKAVGYGVTADAYFALDATDVDDDYAYTNKNLLSAKVAYDTVIEDIEASVAFTGLDLINSQDLTASVSATFGKVSGTVYGGYIVAAETWKAGASATYTEDLYAVTGAIDAATGSLKVSAGISSDTLVSGATLEAGYASGNLLSDPAVLGKAFAKATIAF